MSNLSKGILLATTAAALNASIGIFSKFLMENGLNTQDIAFLKTLTAFLFISLFLLRQPLSMQKTAISKVATSSFLVLFSKIAVCAFLGIFTLFFFETLAYQYGHAANVVVVLMASAAISALLGGRLLLNEAVTVSALLGTAFAIIGITVISWSGSSNWLLISNAALAGSGYGLFSVLVKKFGLNGGIHLTRALMLFGSLYLLIPFLKNLHPITWSGSVIAAILALASLPTILGFYCTTKALEYLSAAKVQVTELSEPIFAMLLAWLFLNEIPTLHFFMGASCIVAGIFLINQMPITSFKRRYKIGYLISKLF